MTSEFTYVICSMLSLSQHSTTRIIQNIIWSPLSLSELTH